MWVAKITIDASNALVGSKARKNKVSLSGYPLSSYEKDHKIYIYYVSFVFGEQENINNFIKEMKEDKRVVNIECNQNFLVVQIEEPLTFKPIHNHKILHIKPIEVNGDGSEVWTIGAWNKSELNEFIQIYEKTHNAKILNIYQENIKDFSIISFQPSLTDKQKEALELAVKNGYYKYPKQIELEKLAGYMNVCYSTYQAHLRKAEQKLIPFFFGRLS